MVHSRDPVRVRARGALRLAYIRILCRGNRIDRDGVGGREGGAREKGNDEKQTIDKQRVNKHRGIDCYNNTVGVRIKKYYIHTAIQVYRYARIVSLLARS